MARVLGVGVGLVGQEVIGALARTTGPSGIHRDRVQQRLQLSAQLRKPPGVKECPAPGVADREAYLRGGYRALREVGGVGVRQRQHIRKRPQLRHGEPASRRRQEHDVRSHAPPYGGVRRRGSCDVTKLMAGAIRIDGSHGLRSMRWMLTNLVTGLAGHQGGMTLTSDVCASPWRVRHGASYPLIKGDGIGLLPFGGWIRYEQSGLLGAASAATTAQGLSRRGGWFSGCSELRADALPTFRADLLHRRGSVGAAVERLRLQLSPSRLHHPTSSCLRTVGGWDRPVAGLFAGAGEPVAAGGR